MTTIGSAEPVRLYINRLLLVSDEILGRDHLGQRREDWAKKRLENEFEVTASRYGGGRGFGGGNYHGALRDGRDAGWHWTLDGKFDGPIDIVGLDRYGAVTLGEPLPYKEGFFSGPALDSDKIVKLSDYDPLSVEKVEAVDYRFRLKLMQVFTFHKVKIVNGAIHLEFQAKSCGGHQDIDGFIPINIVVTAVPKKG